MADTGVRDAPNPTAFRMQQAYRWVRAVVADLSEEELRWQPNPTTPSIRFHLFHIARWSDDLQQEITGADRQLWHAEGIAEGWGLDPDALGGGQSGEMLDDETAMALPLPERDVLLAYCDRVFAAADQALAAVGDEDMRRDDGRRRRGDLIGCLHRGSAVPHRSPSGHDRVPAWHPGDARNGD